MAEVRAAGAADADGIAAVYAPHVLTGTSSFETVPPSASEVAERMRSGLPWYVAVERGAVVGYAYASSHRSRPAYRWSVDVSVYLAASAAGRGLGRRLYDRLLSVLADLGHVRAHAGIVLPNPASVALHEAVGFVPVARYPDVGHKLGRWHDVGWWSRPLAPAVPDPREPGRWDGVA